jgi:transcriptional antiterminator NusG
VTEHELENGTEAPAAVDQQTPETSVQEDDLAAAHEPEGTPAGEDPAEDPAVGEDSVESPVAEEDSVETPAVEEAPAVDPVEEFKSQLRRQEGDWFVIHTYAGYENRVKTNLETRIQSLNMEDDIFQIEVPMEEVVEIKNAQRKVVRRVRIPGYVLVRMNLTDASWGAVRHTPGVTGFVGQDAYNPVPLRLDEVFEMLNPVFEAPQGAGGEAACAPAPAGASKVGLSISKTSSRRSGTGLYASWPTKPVTPGVCRTAPQEASVRSIRTST